MSPYDGDVREIYPAIIGPPPKPTMREIGEAVAARHGMTLAELKMRRSARKFSRPRQEAMALSYATGLFSGMQIARFYGLTDHQPVFHARRVYAQRQAEAQ